MNYCVNKWEKNSLTINKNISGKNKRQIKIFNIATHVIYNVVFNKFVFLNQFII